MAPADSAAAVVKFTISIPHESCTNAKAKYCSSVVPPDPSVHFYHWKCYILSLGKATNQVVLTVLPVVQSCCDLGITMTLSEMINECSNTDFLTLTRLEIPLQFIIIIVLLLLFLSPPAQSRRQKN